LGGCRARGCHLSVRVAQSLEPHGGDEHGKRYRSSKDGGTELPVGDPAQHARQKLDAIPRGATLVERQFIAGATGDVVVEHGVEALARRALQVFEIQDAQHGGECYGALPLVPGARPVELSVPRPARPNRPPPTLRMLDVVSQWVAHYGYLLVAVFLLIEGAGVPVPGETALVTAAALAGRGTLSIVGVVIAGVIGTVAGARAGYWIALRVAAAIVHRYGRCIRLTPPRLEKTHRFFAQHGAKTVLLGRFVAFLRSFIGIFAGISRMPARTFALYNLAGGLVWVGVFSALGYAFGRNLPRLVHYIGRVSLVLAVLIAIVGSVVSLWRWFDRSGTAVAASRDQRLDRAGATPRMVAVRQHHPRLWRVMTIRPHAEYLVLHLAVGFLLSPAVLRVLAA